MQIRLLFCLAVPLGIILALVVVILSSFGESNVTSSTLIAVGIALSFLLLPWLTRRVFYVLAKPGFALLGSCIYALLTVGGILYIEKFDLLNARSAIVVLSGAGLVSSLILIYILTRLTDHNIKISTIETLIQNLRFGKWLIWSGLLIALSGQAPIFLASSILGLQEAGALRALQTLIQPMILATTAITALSTPNLATEYVSGNIEIFKQKARLISLAMTGFAVLFELLLLLFWSPIESIVYRGRFLKYAPMLPYWGIIAVILAGASGMQASFQAAKKTEGLLIGAAVWTLVCFGTGIWFTNRWGLWGLTVSTLVGYIILGLTFAYFYWLWFYVAKPHTV